MDVQGLLVQPVKAPWAADQGRDVVDGEERLLDPFGEFDAHELLLVGQVAGPDQRRSGRYQGGRGRPSTS